MKRTGQHQQTFTKQEDGTYREVPLESKPVVIGKLKDSEGNEFPIDHEQITREELMDRATAAIAAASHHYLEWEGPWAVCQTCPFKHSVPLDFQKFDLIDGVPVKKEPIAQA